jgi:hypothetical protein
MQRWSACGREPLACSHGIRADKCQVEPWSCDQPDVGRMFLAPAQLEQVISFLDRDGLPKGAPLAVVFGQHEMIDVDLVPIFGQRLAVGGGICCDGFVVLCLARGFR